MPSLVQPNACYIIDTLRVLYGMLDTRIWCRIGTTVPVASGGLRGVRWGEQGARKSVALASEQRSAGMDGRERVAEFGRELREGPEPSDRSIKEIIDAIRPQVQELVNKQIELAQTELTPVAKRGGLAAGLLAAAGVFMLVFLI